MEKNNTEKNVAVNAKVFPKNNEAEQSVLCCLLIDGDVAGDYVSKISPDYFYNKLNREIFMAMQALDREAKPIDIITVNDQLEKTGGEKDYLTYLTELASLLPSGANCEQYVKIIQRDSVLRTIIGKCNEIIEDAYTSTDADRTLRLAEKLIYEISKDNDKSDLKHISAPAAELIDRMDAIAKDKNAFRGLATGFNRFDKVTNGLQKGDLIILSARPSVGKTAFALNIVANIVKRPEKKVIAFYSLEMPAVQIAQRILSNLASVDMQELSSGELIGTSHRSLWEMTKTLSDSRVFINDSSMISPKDILTQCRRLTGASRDFNKIDLIVVDYLGLMTKDDRRRSDNRQQEISDMSRYMKIIAKEMNCPVILLCQMSRMIENRDDKTPQLSDLRESGAIEQDADIVLFLSREDEKDKENSPILLDIAKHRNGKLDRIRLNWIGKYIRFIESENQSAYIPKPKTENRDNDDSNIDS